VLTVIVLATVPILTAFLALGRYILSGMTEARAA
jgi:ABC-type glycerol-3-phosphate transport system permease component